MKIPKIFVLRRGLFAAAGCLAAALAILYIVNHPLVAGVSAAARELPIYSVQRDFKVCSLTFDAAWGDEDTGQLIEILAKYNIRATFFVVGDWVDRFPDSVRALFDAGHEIMNHSDTHANLTRLSREEIVAEIDRCNDKIEAVTGVRPTLMRPPYGAYDNTVISAVRAMGIEPLQWDVDSLDWRNITAAAISERVTTGVRPGSIVLFHNAAPNTPAALPEIIETLIRNGYSFLPVSELLLTGDYTIDHTGRQHPVSGAAEQTALTAGLL